MIRFNEKEYGRSKMLGFKGVTSNDDGLYRCHECGSEWQSGSRYTWWPIALRWSWPKHGWFSFHGVQTRFDAIEQRVMRGVLRLGPVLVLFGRDASPSVGNTKENDR